MSGVPGGAFDGDSPPSAASWPPGQREIEAARDGDRDALGDILSRGYPKLVAFYRGMGLSPSEAEDLAAEACEGMIRSFAHLRASAAFEGWFWTIARNRFRTALRRRGRRVEEPRYPLADDPGDEAVTADEHATIRRALGQLSARDREILWLREVEELSHREIAGRLGLTSGAIRVAALRARRRLEEAYRQAERKEG